MEEIVPKRNVPQIPERIFIHYANQEFHTGEDTQITDLSEAGIRDMVQKVRDGRYQSLYLTPNEYGEIEEGFLQLESAGETGLLFLQICGADELQTAWACFHPDYLDSDEEAPIEPSDGQSVFFMRYTMNNRELAAECVEWYAHTGEPYPGMDWLKMTW